MPLKAIPTLSKGRGNKVFQVKDSKLSFIAIFKPGQKVVVYSGKRKKVFNRPDLAPFKTDLGKRGRKLPRGFQKVDHVDITD